jgi:hypothetical protein
MDDTELQGYVDTAEEALTAAKDFIVQLNQAVENLQAALDNIRNRLNS